MRNRLHVIHIVVISLPHEEFPDGFSRPTSGPGAGCRHLGGNQLLPILGPWLGFAGVWKNEIIL